MSFTNELETRVLTWALTTGTVVRPETWFVGLFTAAPGEAGGGTEIAGGSYIRQPITFTISGNLATNGAAIEWPVASGNWGTVTHAAVFTTESGGVMLVHAPLTNAKTISTGDALRIPINDFDITLD
jgi:hypothetical protein